MKNLFIITALLFTLAASAQPVTVVPPPVVLPPNDQDMVPVASVATAEQISQLQAEIKELRSVFPSLLKNAVQNMATNQNLLTTNGTVNPDAVKAGIVAVAPDQYKGLVEAVWTIASGAFLMWLGRFRTASANGAGFWGASTALFHGSGATTPTIYQPATTKPQPPVVDPALVAAVLAAIAKAQTPSNSIAAPPATEPTTVAK